MLLDLLLASAFIFVATTLVAVLPGALRAPGPLSVGLGTLALQPLPGRQLPLSTTAKPPSQLAWPCCY